MPAFCYIYFMSFDGLRQPQQNFPQTARRRRSRFQMFVFIFMFLLTAGGIFIGSKLVIFAQKIFEGEKFSFARLFTDAGQTLEGEASGEIKILLMGIGGGTHDGATLADTIILATIKLANDKKTAEEVSLFSVPRDLAVEIPEYGLKKINSAYAYGEAEGKHDGPRLATEAVENMLNTDIPYYAVIDFEGFKKVIDHLGGIEIDVPVGFTDAEFPDDRGGYLKPLVFETGRQTMDGRRALQFARSRHGNNNQGSDFARANRQQLVLKALKDHVLRLKVLINPGLVDQLLSDLSDHARTNLEPRSLMRLYDLTKNLQQENILSLGFEPGSALICDYISELDGAFLLIPCAGVNNYSDIRKYWKNQFVDARLAAENPRIEIQNASGEQQLAAYTAALLGLPHVKALTGNFTGGAVYTQSVLYDNTGGKKPHTLSYLQEALRIKTAASPFPFKHLNESGADFVIVVTDDIKK